MTRPSLVPREVGIAGALLTALAAMLVLSGVLGLIYGADAVRTLQADSAATGLSDATVATAARVAVVVAIVLGGLLGVAAVAVRRGLQWGRVLAFVGAGTMIALTALGALGGAGALSVVLLGASVGIVALLMQGSVAPYFDRDRR